MYEDEFEQLWQKQASFDGELLNDSLKNEIKDETIFYQRPLRWDPETIGNCELEPGEKRCPRGDWHARRFRILQTVNNLKINNPDGTQNELTEEQRTIILNELFSRNEVTLNTTLRRKLGLIEKQVFNIEEKALEKKEVKLKGDEFVAQLKSKSVLGEKTFKSLSESDLIEINDALMDDTLEDAVLISQLMEQYGLSEEQATAVVNISLPQKYLSFSRLAIQKLLPHMEKGLLTHEAIQEVYGHPQAVKDTKLVDRLGFPEDLRNPIVNKALWEVRKVVNAIIRENGKPASIVIEMARDVKGSLEERKKIRQKQFDQEQENKRAEEELRNIGITKPSRDDIIKYKLWEECGCVCPYTGKAISQTALFGPHPEFQVEHILPYSRTLDDSYMNKTLCWVNENIDKGNQTPYEYYAENKKEQFEQILQRIAVLPYPKRRRFWQKEVQLDTFIERQLNDTRYINRKVVEYMKTLGVSVRGSKGQITAELRHQWGLNSILDLTGPGLKNREDHRHHAIDAAVTAVVNQKQLHALAESKYSRGEHTFNPPWQEFRDNLEATVNTINVSHEVTRKVSGKLHEETNYGPTGLKDNKGQNIYVYRKKLKELSRSMVKKIVDDAIRETVKERLFSFGIDIEKKGEIPKEVWTEPLFMKSKKNVKVEIKKVRIREPKNNIILLKDKAGKAYRAVEPGNNHHIEIFEYTDKKGKIRKEGEIITLFEAVQRSRNKNETLQKNIKDGNRFLYSLAQNEMFMLKDEEGKFHLHRVQYITLLPTGPRIVLRPHTYAGQLSESDKPPVIQRKTPNTLEGYKVTVDPLGRIFPAKD
jgi:CRISPR-associated endonuclease Csn1